MLLLLDLQSDLIKHTLFQRIDYNMKNIFSVLLIAISIPLFAETKTFIREYTYTASEADSKITSRAIALDQVKRMLLEEIGIYLKSEFQTAKQEKNGVYSELTKEQTQSITAGITETKILEERWNGETYYIKASITVDPDEVTKTIARIAADQNTKPTKPFQKLHNCEKNLILQNQRMKNWQNKKSISLHPIIFQLQIGFRKDIMLLN